MKTIDCMKSFWC